VIVGPIEGSADGNVVGSTEGWGLRTEERERRMVWPMQLLISRVTRKVRWTVRERVPVEHSSRGGAKNGSLDCSLDGTPV
jgi:hypothetical protein